MGDQLNGSVDPKALLEILFWLHPNGIKEVKLLRELKLSKKDLTLLLQEWQQDLQKAQRAFFLEKKEEDWFLSPKKEYSAYALMQAKQKKLPLDQREVIALLYYERCLTKSAIDEKRGKNSQSSLKKLISQGFVEEKEQGYSLTQDCLQFLGLQQG